MHLAIVIINSLTLYLLTSFRHDFSVMLRIVYAKLLASVIKVTNIILIITLVNYHEYLDV